jgi:uncharacterized protein YjaZ
MYLFYIVSAAGRRFITAADQDPSHMPCCSGDRYGSFVRQLLVDYEDPLEVNNQLETMGYNIGVRLVDDFFAKSKISASIMTKNPWHRCSSGQFPGKSRR